jgi:hypothetical protein
VVRDVCLRQGSILVLFIIFLLLREILSSGLMLSHRRLVTPSRLFLTRSNPLSSQLPSEIKSPWKTKDKVISILNHEDARRALEVLYKRPDVYWGCDTEVANIDVKTQGPVGNGNVICMSIYGGPTIDFGNGPGSVLWIENLNQSAGLLQEFKPWLEDSRYKKVWHNYGFDRHVLFNEGINCLGFGGDFFLSLVIEYSHLLIEQVIRCTWRDYGTRLLIRQLVKFVLELI